MDYPPFLVAFAGLVNSLVSRKPEEINGMKEDLMQLKGAYDGLEPTDRLDMVKHCKLEKMFRPDLRRLAFVLIHAKAGAVMKALVALGGQRKQGRAPAGFMEREIQDWLEAIE